MGWTSQYFTTIIIEGNSPQTGMFVYQGAPALGSLIASITPAAGTDPYGNSFLQGINAYQKLGSDIFAMSLNVPSGGGLPGFSIEDITNLPGQPAGYYGEANSTVTAFIFMTSGATLTPGDVAASLQAYSQTQWGATGGGIVLQSGDIQYNINGTIYDWLLTAANELVLSSTVDSNQYNVGTITRHATALPQTINSASNQLITGLSANIYPGLYDMEVNLQFHGNQAAGAPQFQIAQSSGTIINRWGNGIIWDSATGTNRFVANTSNMIYAGPTLSTNEWVVILKGFFQCSVAGVIGVNALTSIAADTYVIDNAMFTLKRRS